MVSLKDILTKDARPIKTIPQRRPGLASGLCTSFSALIALIVLSLLWLLGIQLNNAWKIGLLVGSQLTAVVLYNFWVDYCHKLES